MDKYFTGRRGFGRFHFQENIQFCRQSRGSICELIDDFNECYANKYIDQNYRDQLKDEAYNLIKILNGYIASIRSQKSKADSITNTNALSNVT